MGGPSANAGIKPIPFATQAPPSDPNLNNRMRTIGLYFALGVVFLRYSGLHEVMTYYGGFNSGALYIFAIPALFCLAGSGGFQRVLSMRPARYWLGFIIWLCVTV